MRLRADVCVCDEPYLFLGHAETIFAVLVAFAIYRRRGG